ncbi:replication-relaxation family protein [Geodermatophilus sp. SYSU D00525]
MTSNAFDSPFVLSGGEVNIFAGTPAPRADPAGDALTSRPGNLSRKQRPRRGVAERGVFPQGRDLEVVGWLARVRLATAPQVMRRVWPREAMPPRQAVSALLSRLQRLGWVEKRTPLATRWPVYQLTRAGYDVSCDVYPDVETQYLAHPSAATLEHTLLLNDCVIAWENGRGWLPDGFSRPVRIVTEREITAVDKAPMRRPAQYQAREQSRVFLAPGGEPYMPDEPVYGYLSVNGSRAFPDALIVSVGSQRGGRVRGAIAVEYERTDKDPRDYQRVLLAYRRTAERTGKYAHVLYISPSQTILAKVRAAAIEVGAEDMVLTLAAPQPRYDRFPERTTPLRPKRPQPEMPPERMLRQVPKRDLIAWLQDMGLADAAAEALEPIDDSAESADPHSGRRPGMRS